MSRVDEAIRRTAALAGDSADRLIKRATFSTAPLEWLPAKGGDADQGPSLEVEQPPVGPGQRNDEREEGWDVQELLDEPWAAKPASSRGDVSADLRALDRVLTATPAPRRRATPAVGRSRT